MDHKKLCVFNWSGGKDSTLALHHVLQDKTLEVKYLLTTISEEYNRVSMHGLRVSLLRKQAYSIGIKLYEIYLPENASMESYTILMDHHLEKLKNEGITHSIFGDIFLEDLKRYREEKNASIGLETIFPIWGRDTKKVINEFLALNYKTIIICAQQNLAAYCGKIIEADLIESLPSEVDVCGENGEFHTFTFAGPIFKQKLSFRVGEKVNKTYSIARTMQIGGNQTQTTTDQIGYWFIDLIEE
ncbi:MAG: adenine nucleotide alpha hydrolase [Pedobacter sp.]|nr:adenine nucleotide alpha hydrolase [Pedobacter sp.]